MTATVRAVARNPQPNLRQVHLIHAELFAELAEEGFTIAPGELGENVTTSGIDLLRLLRLLRLPRRADERAGHLGVPVSYDPDVAEVAPSAQPTA